MTMFSCTGIRRVLAIFSLALIFKNTPGVIGGNVTENKLYNWFKGIEQWEPPEEAKRELPFYQSGWDYEGRPVYVSEFGKWDVRKYVDSGKAEDKDLLYKRCEKIWYVSSSPYPQTNSSEEGAVLIVDAGGLSAYQLASTGAVTFQLSSMRILETFESYFVDVFIVNVNFVVESWINLIRPVAGRMLGRAVVVSSDKRKIGAILRQKIPKDQLPPWLGGSEGFKPVRII